MALSQLDRARIPAIRSVRRITQFFAPSTGDSENEAPVQLRDTASGNDKRPFSAYPGPRRVFLDPTKFYPEVEITDSSILDSVLQITYESVKLWLEICTANLTSTAQTGSFIEFIHKGEIHFGAVLREPYARFNAYHNRMIVLTLHNELVKVHPQDITFAMHRVLDGGSMSPHHILANRFNASFGPRAKLVQIIHQFIAVVAETRRVVARPLQISYSNLASVERATPVCFLQLARLTHALDPVHLPSYFHQSAFLMAMYLQMCSDPTRWMVPGCMPSERITNLSLAHCSNSITPPPVLYAVPVPVFDALLSFLQSSEGQLRDFSGFVESLLRTPPKFDDLVLQFGIWDGRRYSLALRAMMHAVVYPHSQILAKLSLAPLMGPHLPSRESLVAILRKIGLYDNPQNPLTDPLLSAGLLGKVKTHVLIASSAKDLDTGGLQHSASVDAKKNSFADNFPHLRKSRLFFHDTKAYIVPGLHANLAVSMEEINSRRFLINIHVADLASRLSPSSATYAKWSECNAFLDNTRNLQGIEKSSLLPSEATQDVFFRKPRHTAQKDYFAVGDFMDSAKKGPEGGTQTCMTITFEYNSYLDDPMKNLSESATISFDALQDSQFKTLDPRMLEKSLTGKLEPSIFGKLKLFHHKETKEPHTEEQLDSEDHYNLNFIYNVLKRHFEARNRNYAVSTNHNAHQRDVYKMFSATDSDTIKTHVMLTKDEEILEKTRFMRSEAEILAGRLASEYTDKNKIPVFYDSKELIDAESPDSQIRDEVLIRHENMLLPDFTAASYFQLPYGRDVNGHIPISAYLVACNFLGMDTVSMDPTAANVSLGLRTGLVNVVDATQSMRSYLNQLQILEHVHFTQTANAHLFKDARRFSHLKALGYGLHGAMSRATLEEHTEKLMACAIGGSYLAARQRKYWVLKSVEQDPARFSEMKCVITHVFKDIDMGLEVGEDEPGTKGKIVDESLWPYSEYQTVRAYCEELGIEVDMLVGRERRVMVGSEQIATRILHVDAVLSQLLLG
ncbi:hypothetical protein METBIDRAFT_10564 [Metschnikowia bicuspidata var. bicuspidata NRRL YB-4993]|uniref:Uncharacterized protein n=1 Tax=Metschnikowia bicuspidata var. bicuspidata NRRL YB-4993 TaxID=869754 RepID=A0A1A0HJS4_9ASCO|nr:hypothetical protein METBIDRAFT_10564 [Metschnikowia bicuspidata var. bicuspidata NRRL YB-4993]OBA24424.1 hypothetical protein METBIDRAFT_10564 [Metschnikowia bicuspidata var. bicuspidata NRRL YB-4993]